MSNLLAIDSTHRDSIAALKAAGVVAFGGYLDYPGHRDDWKALEADFANELLDNGIAVELLCETTIDAALKGYLKGHEHGRIFAAAADALGPRFTHATLVATVDTNAPGYAAVADYHQGFIDGAGPNHPVAFYAQRNIIDGSVAAGRSVAGHQSNARAWSSYTVSPHADLLQGLPQSGGPLGSRDPDQILNPATTLLVWPANHHNTTTEVAFMALSDTEQDELLTKTRSNNVMLTTLTNDLETKGKGLRQVLLSRTKELIAGKRAKA